MKAKSWWKIQMNKFFGATTNKMDELEVAIQNVSEQHKKATDNYASLKGKEKYYQDQVAKAKNLKKKLQKKGEELVEDEEKNRDILKLIPGEMKGLDNKIKMFNESLKVTQLALVKQKTVVTELEKSLATNKNIRDELKIKEQFSKDMKDTKVVLGTIENDIDVEELKKEVEIEYNASAYALENDIVKKEKSLDDILESGSTADEEYDKFIASLKK